MTRVNLVARAFDDARRLNNMSAPLTYKGPDLNLVVAGEQVRRDPPLAWRVAVRDTQGEYPVMFYAKDETELLDALILCVNFMYPD